MSPFALGMAQQMKKPIAIVCTSGSALLNYYPAVAEAFYSQIPLVIISADRPTEKIDIGDGQTIRQRNVYENHILYSANLTEEASQENDLKISDAITLALNKKAKFILMHLLKNLYMKLPQRFLLCRLFRKLFLKVLFLRKI